MDTAVALGLGRRGSRCIAVIAATDQSLVLHIPIAEEVFFSVFATKIHGGAYLLRSGDVEKMNGG